MATVIKNKKDGKVVSYKFRVYLGLDEYGKQIAEYSTWYIPDGMTPSKAEKAAKKAAEAWEKKVKLEFISKPKGMKKEESEENKKLPTKFTDFVNDVWLPVFICNGERKTTTVSFYKNISKKLVEYWKNKKLSSISSVDIQKYLIYLRTECTSAYGKPLSDKTILHYFCVISQIFELAVKYDITVKEMIKSQRFCITIIRCD